MSRTRSARPAAAASLCLSALVLGGVPEARGAQFACESPGDRRHLRLELPGEEHLCEVSVSYLGSGERRVMWYADNDSTFCSDRLDELRGKYESNWGFECTALPDPSGVDALDVVRRAAIDAELRRRRATLGEGERLVGVRVDGGTPTGNEPLDATEFFVRGADGEVRTALVLERDGRTVARTEDLVASLSTGGVPVRGAWVEAVGADGAVRVITETEAGDGTCRGRQTLRADADGDLVPSSPHRFACDTVQASGDAALR